MNYIDIFVNGKRKQAFVDETATKKRAKQLECAVCLDIFDDPVTITCGHTFCRGCIRCGYNQNCPLCKKKFTGSLQKSVVLADLADDFVFDMEDDDERADALGRRFLNAARENNHIRMSLLLQKGADIDYTDDASNNALLLYCQHDDMDNDMFYDLVLSDETSINFDSDNYCALHHLCSNGGHRFYVEALLEKIEKQCKDVGYSDFIDDDENSPLSYAIEESMGGVCLQLLRMGADVSQLNSYEEDSLKDLVFKQILHEAEEVRNKKKKCEENGDDDESNNDEEEEESNEEEEEGDDDESDEDKGSEQSDSYEYNEVYCVSSGSE